MKKLFTFAALAVCSVAVHAADKPKVICVFDPVGNSGDIMTLIKDFQVKTPGWGKDVSLKAHTDENVIVNELKAGACDGAVLTGLSARPFNNFTTTVEAVGGTLSNNGMKTLLSKIMRIPPAKAEKYFRKSHYEIAAIIPAGAVYAFLSDKKYGSIASLQGRRVAVLQGDKVSQSIVKQVGASTVMATTSTFGGQFNNGNVDVVFAPAVAYEPLELYRGIGTKGGVMSLPLLQLTLQLVIRWDQFPSNFGTNTRKAAAENFDAAFEYIGKARDKIKKESWVSATSAQRSEYELMFQKARIRLGKEGVYNPTMLKIMRKVRCAEDGKRIECSQKVE